MKTKKILITGLLLAIFSSFAVMATPVKNAQAEGLKTEKIAQVEEMKTAKIELQTKDVTENEVYNDFYSAFPEEIGSNREIGAIKELQDFADNKYYVVEFAPYGYMIYDNTFTMAIEANAAAESPYLGINQGLIYAGATNYYIKPVTQLKSGYLFNHAVLDEELVVSNDTELATLKKQSETFSNNVNKSVKELQAKEQMTTMATATVQVSELSNSSRIRNLSTAGYNTDGRCAWVAASIIVWYHRVEWGWSNLAPSGWNSQLNDDIRNGRSKAASLSDVRWALEAYVSSVGGIPKGYGVMDTIWPNASTIYDRVNSNIPVIIGSDTMPDPTGGDKMAHAVVVHKVDRTAKKNWIGITEYKDYHYWAHFGWGTSYNNVMLTHASFKIDSRCNFQ